MRFDIMFEARAVGALHVSEEGRVLEFANADSRVYYNVFALADGPLHAQEILHRRRVPESRRPREWVRIFDEHRATHLQWAGDHNWLRREDEDITWDDVRRQEKTMWRAFPALRGTTAGGEQPKFELEGLWYKSDVLGGECLTEWLVSSLLECSDIDYPFVRYWPEGDFAASADFTEGDIIVTAADLLMLWKGVREISVVESIEVIAEYADSALRIPREETIEYLRWQLFIDWLVVNPDRHLNNIIFLVGPDAARPGPLFDHGQALGVGLDNVSWHEQWLHKRVKCRYLVRNMHTIGKYVRRELRVDHDLLRARLEPFRFTDQYRWLNRVVRDFLT